MQLFTTFISNKYMSLLSFYKIPANQYIINRTFLHYISAKRHTDTWYTPLPLLYLLFPPPPPNVLAGAGVIPTIPQGINKAFLTTHSVSQKKKIFKFTEKLATFQKVTRVSVYSLCDCFILIHPE